MIFVTIGIFLNKDFKIQTYVCNGCHDLLLMSMNLCDISFLQKTKNAVYRCNTTWN